jgi:hypothetical protein
MSRIKPEKLQCFCSLKYNMNEFDKDGLRYSRTKNWWFRLFTERKTGEIANNE